MADGASPPPRERAATGRYSSRRVAAWAAAYLVLAVVPMLVAVVGPIPEPRPFVVEVGVGLGFVGIGVLALQFVTTGRFRSIAPVFGADAVLQFHRQAGIAAVALVLAHPVVLVLADPDHLEYFDPRVNLPRALALGAVVPALVLLLVTSLWRREARLQYEWWRALHGGLSVLVLAVGTAHGIQVGRHLGTLWQQGIWAGLLVGVGLLLLHSRLLRPLQMRRRPWEVVDVRAEVGDAYSITVAPVGHGGMDFTAGQYAWITLGHSPFSLQQHPFSFASSSRDRRITFTAKVTGDFTATWKDRRPGERAFLEGPYGGFTLSPDSRGAVAYAGGIGITPIMSILRTMRDTGDRRPVTLFYANPDLGEATFHDELLELRDEIDLRLIDVLEDPPEGWDGPSGFLDADLIAEHVDDPTAWEHFVCGPEPMMDAVESGLRELGADWRQIYSERFQVV